MTRPIVWTLAGSDSGGGAGIQADLHTLHGLGIHGCSVVTAITAQNTSSVLEVRAVEEDLVRSQIEALAQDLPPAAIKTGLLPDASVIRTVARSWKDLPGFKVCDPVLAAGIGASFMDDEARQALLHDLFPVADMITPNLVEAGILLDRQVQTDTEMEVAARDLMETGPGSVLIKGGHREGPWVQDFWTDGSKEAWVTAKRIEARGTHGTGCILSAAAAGCVALGFPLEDACVVARATVNQALRNSVSMGAGNPPAVPGDWPSSPADLPWLTATAEAGRSRPSFPDMELPGLALYPIVDRAEWVERLLSLGVEWIQLRIKDLDGSTLDQELQKAAAAARELGGKLIINDHWEAALRLGVYGVHLGQDDLSPRAVKAIAEAGLRLGISTHTYGEIARSVALNPSYVAIGTLFHTNTKVLDYPPLGLESFRRMRRLVGVPVVAIGGIHIEHAKEVEAAGADAMAVISEVRDAADLAATIAAWREV